MFSKLLIPALVLAAGAAHAAGLPGVTDGPGPNLVIEVADSAGQSKGKIVLDLYKDKAPKHVERLVTLAKSGAYDGVVFHRVIDGFMAQTGDVEHANMENNYNPGRAGTGGSDLPDLPAEFSRLPHDRGTLGAARSMNPNSANSQFFIDLAPATFLDGQYTVVGQLVDGWEVLNAVKKGDPAANGAVIDIALNTVKVQNWDKTIVTMPTWKFTSESFKNWRGMQESGGRRIKRTLMIDAGSIHFLNDEQIERLGQVKLIADYVKEKADAVKISRAMKLRELGEVLGRVPANQRRLTNIGTFRAYVLAYLKANSGIHPDMTLMVRMLQPTPEGVPLELYCFTNTTAWVDYETIQSDIFDHLLAILPEFGLRVRASAVAGPADAVPLEEGSAR